MANTIDVEASRNSSLIIDIDNHRRRYLKQEGPTSVMFVGPTIVTYERFKFYLLRNSIYKTIDKKYYYKPDYLSFDTYGTTVLWTMLLFINDLASIEEFDKPELYIPSYSSILQIAKSNELNSATINLDEQYKEPSKASKIVLYTNKISPVLVNQNDNLSTVRQDTNNVFYVRQQFELNETNIDSQFVDLGYIPVIESVNLKILNETIVPIYNTHYSIVENAVGENRRLSWSQLDNPNGEGLTSILDVGSKIEVQYAQNEGT